MQKLILSLMTALCLFTASVTEGFCCVEDKGACTSEHHEHSKKSDEQHKEVGSHSCCHAHNIAIKADKFVSAEQVGTSNDYIIIHRKLITQFQPGILLEPPSHA